MSRNLFSASMLVLAVFGPLNAAIPEGYYDPAEGLTGTELQEALHGIIDDHVAIGYDEVWEAFYTTDDKPNGMVWDMYSDIPGGTPPYEYEFGEDQGGTASGEGEGYNREHTWPKSWYGGEEMPMFTDLFVVIPTDIYVNNRRNNYPYGEVAWPSWTSMNGSRLGPNCAPGYVGKVFEPRDEFKGDLARGYFYMATRYLGEDAGWPGSPMADGAVLEPWAEEMLQSWHASDPVSQKELDRNEAIWEIQENRNPFIDHPEYVSLIYGPTGVEEPSAPPGPQPPTCSPNPSRGEVSIAFTLPEPAPTSLCVFDLNGHLVARPLRRQVMAAGSHTVLWSGRADSGEELAAGVYVVRMEADGHTAATPVIRIRP